MRRQQESFTSMRQNEDKEVKKMEDGEQKRYEAYQAKKTLERSKRESKKIAHKKVVSRAIGKDFMSQMKVNTLTFLRDVGMFRDSFK